MKIKCEYSVKRKEPGNKKLFIIYLYCWKNDEGTSQKVQDVPDNWEQIIKENEGIQQKKKTVYCFLLFENCTHV